MGELRYLQNVLDRPQTSLPGASKHFHSLKPWFLRELLMVIPPSGSQSVALRQQAEALPGTRLEMRVLGPHPTPPEPETWCWPRNVF